MNESKMINKNFTANYERFIEGYHRYKADRMDHSDKEVDRYDNSERVEQA